MSSSNDNYVCVFFNNDNSYTVFNDKSKKLKNSKRAQVKYQDKWIEGKIIVRGLF